MTDERTWELPGAGTDEADPGVDAPMDPDRTGGDPPTDEPNPWLREGANAPDAADIEDPDEQR
jgi:hypothetical protein